MSRISTKGDSQVTGRIIRSFEKKVDDLEKKIISEYYQRCFGEDLPESSINISI